MNHEGTLHLGFRCTRLYGIQGQACGTAVKVPTGMPMSHIRVPGMSPSSTCWSNFLLMHTPRGSRWWLNAWFPATHIGDLIEFRAPGFSHGGYLGSEPMDDGFYPLCVCLSSKWSIQKRKPSSNTVGACSECVVKHQISCNCSCYSTITPGVIIILIKSTR